jgi:hypothetical protein
LHGQMSSSCTNIERALRDDPDCRRRGDRARSSMPQRAVRGAGSRARRRLEPPSCRPLTRRRSVKIFITISLEERGRLARSARIPAPSWQAEPFNFLCPVITRATLGLESFQVRERGCPGRLLRPTSLWVSEFPQRFRVSLYQRIRVEEAGRHENAALPAAFPLRASR